MIHEIVIDNQYPNPNWWRGIFPDQKKKMQLSLRMEWWMKNTTHYCIKYDLLRYSLCHYITLLLLLIGVNCCSNSILISQIDQTKFTKHTIHIQLKWWCVFVHYTYQANVHSCSYKKSRYFKYLCDKELDYQQNKNVILAVTEKQSINWAQNMLQSRVPC